MAGFDCEDGPRTFGNIDALLIHIDNDHDTSAPIDEWDKEER